MSTVELPDTVLKALGPDAARDFAIWLEQRLQFSEVPISALVARQKVNVLLLEHVSNLLLADNPTLIQTADGKWIWRVPVDLTFPSHGRVGRVGEVAVDAQYGEVQYTEATLSQIHDKTQQLASQVLQSAS